MSRSISKLLAEASLTTVHEHLTQFRRADNISVYCLKHMVPSEKYHLIHVEQLELLYNYTGEQYFMEMAETFYSDWH